MTVLFSLLTAYHFSRWRSNHIAIMKSSLNTYKFINDSCIHSLSNIYWHHLCTRLYASSRIQWWEKPAGIHPQGASSLTGELVLLKTPNECKTICVYGKGYKERFLTHVLRAYKKPIWPNQGISEGFPKEVILVKESDKGLRVTWLKNGRKHSWKKKEHREISVVGRSMAIWWTNRRPLWREWKSVIQNEDRGLERAGIYQGCGPCKEF